MSIIWHSRSQLKNVDSSWIWTRTFRRSTCWAIESTGIGGEFYPILVHEIFLRQLNAIHERIIRLINRLIKLPSTPCGLDSSTGRAMDRYPECASSNPARVNIFQLISAASDYHGKFFFMYISEDDSETYSIYFSSFDLVRIFIQSYPACGGPWQREVNITLALLEKGTGQALLSNITINFSVCRSTPVLYVIHIG